MGADTKNRYRTPGPGAYDVHRASRQCLKAAPSVSFGGLLNKIDRGKTGPLNVVDKKNYVPGPCSYAVAADYQARGLCERSRTLIFGRATRDDLSKLFLGKDAIAYITSRTPGPGAYELGWQRPFSLFPAREPGPTIGGPLANVDRVQTGPLGPSYRSFTPGPGAYDDDHDRGVRTAPPRRSRRPRGGGGGGGGSTSMLTRASTSESISLDSAEGYRPVSRDAEPNHTPERHRASSRRDAEDGDGSSLADSTCEGGGGSRKGIYGKGPDSRFTLSPFRFVDEQGHDSDQLCFPGRSRAKPKRRRAGRGRKGVGATRSRSPVRNADGARASGGPGSRSPTSRGGILSSSLSVSTCRSHMSSSLNSSSIARPASTFGTGTREQAGHVLAPGFRGEAPRSVIGNPGPGAYLHVPGSLGHQVESTLLTSAASSFPQSDRLCIIRDTGVPGPGAYRAASSLGCQISSTCATAPVPKFGTSVRCALEDGLVG